MERGIVDNNRLSGNARTRCSGRTLTGRAGYTLIELLVYMALAMFLVETIFAIFFRALWADKMIESHLAASNSAARVSRLLDRDIRAAAAFPARFKEFKAGPDCLVLRTVQGIIVYHASQEGAVRADFSTSPAHQRLLANGSRIAFQHDPERPRLVGYSMTLPTVRERQRSILTFRGQAAARAVINDTLPKK